MKHIFESNWMYLAHESQIPNNNDYYTTWIGRQPVVITRDKSGELHAVINACATRAQCCADESMATKAALPARSTAGVSPIQASC